MRIDRYKPPKSSFLSVEKDLSIITGNMEKCSRLKRLLCNTQENQNPLNQPTPEISVSDMIEKGIVKIIPKLTIDKTLLNYLIIQFDNFMPNATNPEYRNNILEFDVVCHFNQWNIGDFQLRPYKIAAELDSMFNGKYLTGIGTLQFLGARKAVLSDEYGAVVLLYSVIHGEEDTNAYTPIKSDQDHFEQVLKDVKEDMDDN